MMEIPRLQGEGGFSFYGFQIVIEESFMEACFRRGLIFAAGEEEENEGDL